MAGIKSTDNELKERVQEAYDLRYNKGFTQKAYVKYMKEKYGDKSEQTYCQYFTKSKDVYDNAWKDRLYKQLGPAVDKVIENLASDDPKVVSDAIKMVFKYTGHEIIKQEINANVNTVEVKFRGIEKND